MDLPTRTSYHDVQQVSCSDDNEVVEDHVVGVRDGVKECTQYRAHAQHT